MNAYEKRKFATQYAQFERLFALQGYSQSTIAAYTLGIRRLSQWCDMFIEHIMTFTSIRCIP